jgi:hypothetical protein
MISRFLNVLCAFCFLFVLVAFWVPTPTYAAATLQPMAPAIASSSGVMGSVLTFLAMLGLMLPPLGAISTAVARQTADELVVNVTATADGDTATSSINNPFGIPCEPQLTLVQAIGAAASPGWAATTNSNSSIVLTKNASVGSGVAGVQLRATLRRPR